MLHVPGRRLRPAAPQCFRLVTVKRKDSKWSHVATWPHRFSEGKRIIIPIGIKTLLPVIIISVFCQHYDRSGTCLELQTAQTSNCIADKNALANVDNKCSGWRDLPYKDLAFTGGFLGDGSCIDPYVHISIIDTSDKEPLNAVHCSDACTRD